MDAQTLRKTFIQFFVSRQHRQLAPAPLISQDDASVLFTTAGMQQFKQFYLKPSLSPARRIVTIQPCLRTSDIEEVGDATHLTLFEMLGNFSFGAYFKREAIELALEFLVTELGIKKSDLTASYFHGSQELSIDKTARTILKKLGFNGKRLVGAGKKDNFWGPVGGSGPCGPTVEFYLNGVEVWNLVFNEYIFHQGKYLKNNQPGIDTGMGLERILALVNKRENIFETDLFQPMMKLIERRAANFNERAARIVSDHLKAAVFLAQEGLIPSNHEQGYVLRRLIRRALVYLKKLDLSSDWLILAKKIFVIYEEPYGWDKKSWRRIAKILNQEKKVFSQTLKAGLKHLERLIVNSGTQLNGEKVFYLFETFGFPLELTRELAQEHHKTVDEKGFYRALEKHRQLSRRAKGRFRGGLASFGEKEIRYHTATHLLLAGLRRFLGQHVEQRGSHITAERLRFDFSHPSKLSVEEIKRVEKWVNDKIKENLPVRMEEISLTEARRQGALGKFDQRYGKTVRVYTIGQQKNKPVSKEICAGPHVKNTGEIGKFKIIKEESSSSGVRRIRAKLI